MNDRERQKRVVHGLIDRRTFLKGAGVTLLSLSQFDRIALAAPGGPPKRGGVLVVGSDVSPPGLDPAKSAAAHTWMVSEHVYSNLLRRSPANRLVPDLAESYEVSGSTTFVFRLRRGVQFHHGRELTSDDVKFTFERMADQRTASPWRSIWLIIERIETPDKYTVRFTTRRPFAPFLSYLGTPHYSAIVPRDVVEKSGDLQQTASGTGPFMLERFVPENVVVLKRNPRYYESGLPYLDGVEYRIIPDEAARLAALRTGTIQYTWSVDPLVDEQVKSMPGVAVLPPKGYCAQHTLVFNQTKPPFNDVRVRRAVSVGINRREIIRAVRRGKGAITTKIPPCDAPFGYSGDEKGLPYYQHNPQLARQLLAEAGYANGIDTTLDVPPRFPFTVRAGEVMREQLAAAGIRVTLRQGEWGQLLTAFVRTTYDGMSMIPTVWQPDPDAHVYDIYHSDSAINLGRFRDPFVDQLLEQGRTELDRNKRIAIYQQLQRHIADQAYMLHPYADGAVELLHENVRGYVSLPGAQPGSRSRHFFKQVWLDR
ncbi:MAG: ABC transporter substrate-binding protein [Armatimonadota bacterium]|nr:ABC transporter substrate-binding protein [Armatimonadota bacterium]